MDHCNLSRMSTRLTSGWLKKNGEPKLAVLLFVEFVLLALLSNARPRQWRKR
jgi:hypothetical protein